MRAPASGAPTLHLYPTPDDRLAAERVGLVLPTSMCSAQIARMAADRMNARGLGPALGFDRFVALTHSEGCGFGGETMYRLLHRTYLGYATHPNVAASLLLEHGCEKIPNDAMRRQFEAAGLPLDRFGWASVQLDGGIEKALERIEAWFAAAKPATAATRTSSGPGRLTLGLLSAGGVGDAAAVTLAAVAAAVLDDGGSVLLPEGDALLAAERFRAAVLGDAPLRATLDYGQRMAAPGLHLVATETGHWDENLAGLGASGVHAFVGLVGDAPQQAHPLLPVIQVAAPGAAANPADIDLVLTGDCEADTAALWKLLARAVGGEALPAANAAGFVDFQLTRGLLGVST